MNTFKGSTFQTINSNDSLSLLVDSEIEVADAYDHVLTIGDKDFSYEEALKIKEFLKTGLPDKYFRSY